MMRLEENVNTIHNASPNASFLLNLLGTMAAAALIIFLLFLPSMLITNVLFIDLAITCCSVGGMLAAGVLFYCLLSNTLEACSVNLSYNSMGPSRVVTMSYSEPTAQQGRPYFFPWVTRPVGPSMSLNQGRHHEHYHFSRHPPSIPPSSHAHTHTHTNPTGGLHPVST